jgi:SAM-dependent methyltransferase
MDTLTLSAFKESQKQGWALFAPLEATTIPAAALLVRHARIGGSDRVLDVGCGTGVAAITAARLGARVSGLDLTPALLDRARENALIAQVDVEWREGDAEALPFEDAAFDAVVSQFGHMFAPRPAVALAEMLRVLKPGGTVAFATWPPELVIGRMLALVSAYMPAPPPGVAPPGLWGDPAVIRERFGTAVTDIVFDRQRMLNPVLSPQHHRVLSERTAGPVIKVVELLGGDPARLAGFRAEYDALVAEYLDGNTVRQDFLLTRATKV